MKKTKVISGKRISTSLPVLPTITMWLLLDRLHAPKAAWIFICGFLAVVWFGALAAMVWTEEVVELKELADTSNSEPTK